MHLAYSALHPNVKDSAKPALSKKNRLRYNGYKAACKKYKHEIASIQQYLPGWQPAFNL